MFRIRQTEEVIIWNILLEQFWSRCKTICSITSRNWFFVKLANMGGFIWNILQKQFWRRYQIVCIITIKNRVFYIWQTAGAFSLRILLKCSWSRYIIIGFITNGNRDVFKIWQVWGSYIFETFCLKSSGGVSKLFVSLKLERGIFFKKFGKQGGGWGNLF